LPEREVGVSANVRRGYSGTYVHPGRTAAMILAPSTPRPFRRRFSDVNPPISGMALARAIMPIHGCTGVTAAAVTSEARGRLPEASYVPLPYMMPQSMLSARSRLVIAPIFLMASAIAAGPDVNSDIYERGMHNNRIECGYTFRSGDEIIIVIIVATNIIAGKIERRQRPIVGRDIR
jgi:hypothetical protein